MNNVVTRSLGLLVLSTILVLLSAAFLQPETAHGGVGHGDTTTGAHAASPEINSEVDFITGMIPHHQEAVASAEQLQTLTERPEMRDLARDVIEVQSDEISTLQGWLEAWYPDAEPDPAYEPMMRDLEGMNPNEADRAFLEDMLMHHDMAIAMARAYLAGDFEKHPEVVAMAEAIVTVQDQENEQMRAWLDEWYGVSGGEHEGH